MTLATRLNRGSVDPFESLGLDAFVRQVFSPEATPATSHAVDVYEDAEHLYIDAELPGFTRDQLDVTIHDGVLTITAERPAPSPTMTLATPAAENTSEGGDGNEARNGNGSANGQSNGESTGLKWHLRERRASRIRRSFSLPKTVDGSSVEAKLNDGVLRLTLTKRAEAKPRKITIA